MSLSIHPTAIVSKDAELGKDVEIGAYCIVEGDTKIGDRTQLMPFSHICEHTILGLDCKVCEHATIGGAPQDISYCGETTWVKIGNKVTCREYVTVNRAVGEGESTIIEDDCLLMEGVHVAHNVRVGKGCTIANKTGLSGHVHVGDFAVIGGMSGFHQFVHVGSYCMVGGMSRVVKDVPPYCLASGAPLFVYDINKIGLRRHGIESDSRMLIRRMYKIIYSSGNATKETLANIEHEYGNTKEAKMILAFAAESKRGLSPRIKLSTTRTYAVAEDENN